MPRTRVLLVAVLALSAPLVVGARAVDAVSGSVWHVLTSPGASVVASGSATAVLLPGQRVPIDLVLTNDGRAEARVHEVRVVVTGVEQGRPAADVCDADDFTTYPLRSARGTIRVPAQGRVAPSAERLGPEGTPGIELADLGLHQDACQDARVSLAFVVDPEGSVG